MENLIFRVWDKKRALFHYHAELYGAMQPVFLDGEELLFSDFILQPDRFIIQQFTGICDDVAWKDLAEKEREQWILSGMEPSEWNGHRIYEGDIVELSMYFNSVHFRGPQIGEVVWAPHTWGWALYDKKTDSYTTPYHIPQDSKLVVIGNVCENPELLDRKI